MDRDIVEERREKKNIGTIIDEIEVCLPDDKIC